MREVKEAANTKRPEDGRQKGVVRTQIGVLCSCVRPKGPWTIGIFVAPSNAIKSNDLGHKPDVSMQNMYIFDYQKSNGEGNKKVWKMFSV
ncbi:uncharacterized protein LOC111066337 isoform X2 [Drosophila obscura]|uniref:uncharacterized protein LOC111066337 isoform X2 n=1 Tax=Drosophila obscura TaxID=7282 RepID=UPI001BB1719E|nr:uncharacterized protein LOC111066337 isoform X2 [Drosophila obscura]